MEMSYLWKYVTEQDVMRAFSETVCRGFTGTGFHNGRILLINFNDNHNAHFEILKLKPIAGEN
jgi:hypothetical protein